MALAVAGGACTRGTPPVSELLNLHYTQVLARVQLDHVVTTRLAAAQVPVDVLMERALMSVDPLEGLVYAEALLERAADEDQRSYARLRIAQRADALHDAERATQELLRIPDDCSSPRSENRMYEKYIELASIKRAYGDGDGAYCVARELLQHDVRHAQNKTVRLAALATAARCAVCAGDMEAARRFLSEITNTVVDGRVLRMSIESAQRALTDLDRYVQAARRAQAELERRRTRYARLSRRRTFDQIVRANEAAERRPLTAVERVQLMNHLKDAVRASER